MVCQTKQAEIGQGLSQLTTERETGKNNQNSTEPSRWNESYHNVNQFEDADLKLGESETDDVDPLSTPVSPPYTDGVGCLNSRYEDASPKQRNIIVHATEQTTQKTGSRYAWEPIDIERAIVSSEEHEDHQDQGGKHRDRERLGESREASQKLATRGGEWLTNAMSYVEHAIQYTNDEVAELLLSVKQNIEGNGDEGTGSLERAKDLVLSGIGIIDNYQTENVLLDIYKLIDLFRSSDVDVSYTKPRINEFNISLSKHADDQVKDQKDYRGIKIDIEWPKGSIRSYEGDDTYVTHMKCDYGYAKGVEGTDADSLDIYLGDADSDTAYVVEQLKEDGSYDEDKLMVGFLSEEDAADMYLQHMPAYMLGDIREIPIDKLKNALYSQPDDRRGEADLVPAEEMSKEAYQSKIASYRDYAEKILSTNGGASLFSKYVDFSSFHDNVSMVDEVVRVLLTHGRHITRATIVGARY